MKTAVEFYAEQMQLKEQFTQEEFNNITNQAKEMEKQQIIDFAVWFNNNDNSYKSYTEIIKQYCNETFKNK